MIDKNYVANFINRNCLKATCFICGEADKHGGFSNCPYLELKQEARNRKITSDDISDELLEKAKE